MHEAVSGAIISIGILGGISGSARAQIIEGFGLFWDGAKWVSQNSNPIGRPYNSNPPLGHVCVGRSGLLYPGQPALPIGSPCQAITPWGAVEQGIMQADSIVPH
jgi:hypothetical protein